MHIKATAILDDEWVEVITEELILMPDRVAFSVEPSALGAYDGQQGNPCMPYERGYRTLADCENYIAAWRDANEAMTAAANALADYHDWIEFQNDILWEQRGVQ